MFDYKWLNQLTRKQLTTSDLREKKVRAPRKKKNQDKKIPKLPTKKKIVYKISKKLDMQAMQKRKAATEKLYKKMFQQKNF